MLPTLAPPMPEFSTRQHMHLVYYVQAMIKQIAETPHNAMVKELSAIARGMIKALAEAGALPAEEKEQLLHLVHCVSNDAHAKIFQDTLRDNPKLLDA